jgi:hypothetical protein
MKTTKIPFQLQLPLIAVLEIRHVQIKGMEPVLRPYTEPPALRSADTGEVLASDDAMYNTAAEVIWRAQEAYQTLVRYGVLSDSAFSILPVCCPFLVQLEGTEAQWKAELKMLNLRALEAAVLVASQLTA